MSSTMSSDAVLVTVEGPVATLTLNRPKSLNSLDEDVAVALLGALERVSQDESVRCLVLTGAGAHFMAGGDVKFFAAEVARESDREARRQTFERFVGELTPIVYAMRSMPKPIVASVRGAVAGFGLSLMLGCDLVVAGDDAFFTLAYCHIGTSPDGASSYALPRVVGMKRAMEIALLGDRFDAKKALDWGLVNQVVPTAELEAATRALSTRLASGPTVAYGRTKALLHAAHANTLEAQLRLEARSFAACATTDDFAEGVTSFTEKRKPVFLGR